LWNKNEHIDSNLDNITAKNITTSDSINVGTNLGKLKIGTGSISFGNGDGYGLSLGKAGSPTLTIWDNNWITAKGTLDAQEISAHTLTATGPIGGWDVNAKNNINAGGIVTAKKFVSTDGSSSGALSNEAIQNIASVYNKDNLTATNINATNGINTPTLSAKNITTSDSINVGSNLGKLKLGTGSISFGNGDGYGLSLGKESSPSMIVYDNKWTSVNGTLDVNGGPVNANGGFKTPLDMTRVNAKMMNLYSDTGYDDSFCPDGYYMYGVSKASFGRGTTFDPACRKLPGV